MIEKLYEHFVRNKDELPELYRDLGEKFGIEKAVCDYVAGMTDSYAIRVFSELFIPKGWQRV